MRGQRFDERPFEKCDHRRQDRWALDASKGKVVAALLLVAASCALGDLEAAENAGTAAAAAAASPSSSRDGWRLVLEPAFMHRAVTFGIAHAKRTVIAPVQLTAEREFSYPAKQEFEANRLTQASIAGNGMADADLAELKPRFVRNRRNIIVYAELRADRPIVASAVLSSKFLAHFRDTLGDALLVAVPNRFTAFVFPALGNDYQQYAPLIIGAYRETPFPVSLEVFHVSADGWKAVGIFDDR
jgi:hypothetical protein